MCYMPCHAIVSVVCVVFRFDVSFEHETSTGGERLGDVCSPAHA